MALDISKLRNRLNSLSNNKSKSMIIWKPNPGKQVVRIVPYKFEPENPFIELKFHYGLNGKTFLSPDTFGRPDPIVEFASNLKSTGDKEDWKFGRNLEPKMRTFVPVIVRGEEQEGVRFWGFGKQVYQELLSIIADPDYGDITDIKGGRDILVEFKTAEDAGKNYPETSIRVKPNVTPAFNADNKSMIDSIKNQTNITEVFQEPSYDELKVEMEKHLNPDGEADSDNTTATEYVSGNTSENKSEVVETKSTKKSTDEVTDAFDKLFNA